MTRPVLLVDIGAEALPVVTPVEKIAASWVPVIYIAPPPPAPLSLQAESVSDGVLLTWSHVGGRGIEFRVERAPDLAGIPGAWIQIGQTVDLRYTGTTAADKVDGYWFRVRAVRNGKYSGYTSQVFQWPYASNPPVKDLVISSSTITIDCRWKKFTLLLDQDVHYVSFVNVSESDTILIYVTQSGGDHKLAFPSWVRSANGVPYVVSPIAGSIDIVGLDTDNGGVDWVLVAQQPAGGGSAFTVVAAPNPANNIVIGDGFTPVAPAQTIDAVQTNGVAPIVVAWDRVDTFGGDDFICSAATELSTTFSVSSGLDNYNAVQTWRCTVTDAVNRAVNTLVTIRLQRVISIVDIGAGLLNGNFEAGDNGWDKGPSISIGASHPYEGARSAQLNVGFYGTSEIINQFSAPVDTGRVLTASCMVHQGASDVGRAGGYVRIKWYDESGGFITNSDGNNVADGRGGAWHPSTVTAAAPAGAKKARLTGVMYRNGQNYVCNVDVFKWAVVS